MVLSSKNISERESMIFFTADHHFGHRNIIQYCNRPFKSVDDMDTAMIQRWNQKVLPQDTVYHLGDFTLATLSRALGIFPNLNGKIYIIPGGHDHWLKEYGKKDFNPTIYSRSGNIVEIMPHYVEIGVDDKFVVLLHTPIESWERKHYGSIHLHGHQHGNNTKMENRWDVGVDNWNFYPVSLDEIIKNRQ